MRHVVVTLSLLMLMLVVSCATAPQRPKPADVEAAWALRQSILRTQRVWDLDGKLAVSTDEDGWHAGVHWRQVGERFRIDLLDPFGRTVARIEGDDDGVALIQRDGEVITAADPESLMQAFYGWALPLSGLRYWVLGIPEPKRGFERDAKHGHLDAYGRLAKLRQGGWAIDYQQYHDTQPIELPQEIALSNRALKVKLVVSEWQLGGL
jgi:outer membrane lipoprotein LolB